MRISTQMIEPIMAVFSCNAEESMSRGGGVLHGGALISVIDTVVGCALVRLLRPGMTAVILELKVRYLQLVPRSGMRLTSPGWVLKRGSRVAFAEGVVTNARAALLPRCRTSYKSLISRCKGLWQVVRPRCKRRGDRVNTTSTFRQETARAPMEFRRVGVIV
jgi:uncharacterized protein (TIGR00369 family)